MTPESLAIALLWTATAAPPPQPPPDIVILAKERRRSHGERPLALTQVGLHPDQPPTRAG